MRCKLKPVGRNSDKNVHHSSTIKTKVKQKSDVYKVYFELDYLYPLILLITYILRSTVKTLVNKGRLNT